MENYLQGIDVSSAQGKIDWVKIKSSGDISFAFIKASEGIGYEDPKFKENWKGCVDNKLCHGAYHFARPDNDPLKEANWFCSVVKNIQKGDMLCLDIEKQNGLNTKQFTKWVLDFCNRVEEITKITPIIYTGGPYFDAATGKNTPEEIKQISHYPLWLAAYTNNPEKFIPEEWKSLGWTIWQATGDVAASGQTILKLPGTNTTVDRDYFKGSLEDFTNFANSLYIVIPEPEQFPTVPTPIIKQPIDQPTDQPTEIINSENLATDNSKLLVSNEANVASKNSIFNFIMSIFKMILSLFKK